MSQSVSPLRTWCTPVLFVVPRKSPPPPPRMNELESLPCAVPPAPPPRLKSNESRSLPVIGFDDENCALPPPRVPPGGGGATPPGNPGPLTMVVVVEPPPPPPGAAAGELPLVGPPGFAGFPPPPVACALATPTCVVSAASMPSTI